jgi:hypothetical protein
MHEISFWSFITFAVAHLTVILFNLGALRKESGSGIQIVFRLARRGGFWGLAYSGTFILMLISGLATTLLPISGS